MPRFEVITSTTVYTAYAVVALDGWEAQKIVNDDEKRKKLQGFVTGHGQDEWAHEVKAL